MDFFEAAYKIQKAETDSKPKRDNSKLYCWTPPDGSAMTELNTNRHPGEASGKPLEIVQCRTFWRYEHSETDE